MDLLSSSGESEEPPDGVGFTTCLAGRLERLNNGAIPDWNTGNVATGLRQV